MAAIICKGHKSRQREGVRVYCRRPTSTPKMSEKYLQIGAPMTALPRPVTSAQYNRIESSLSNPVAGSQKFHDCYNNHSMTNLRDLKDPVSDMNLKIILLHLSLKGSLHSFLNH